VSPWSAGDSGGDALADGTSEAEVGEALKVAREALDLGG